jgi:hypothetical protein
MNETFRICERVAYLPSRSPESQLVHVYLCDQFRVFLRCLLRGLDLKVADESELLGQRKATLVMPLIVLESGGIDSRDAACESLVRVPKRILLAEQRSLFAWSHFIRFATALTILTPKLK